MPLFLYSAPFCSHSVVRSFNMIFFGILLFHIFNLFLRLFILFLIYIWAYYQTYFYFYKHFAWLKACHSQLYDIYDKKMAVFRGGGALCSSSCGWCFFPLPRSFLCFAMNPSIHSSSSPCCSSSPGSLQRRLNEVKIELMKKIKKHRLFSHFMSPELWLFFLQWGCVCVFFVSEMVIPIGGCIASAQKESIHRRRCTTYIHVSNHSVPLPFSFWPCSMYVSIHSSVFLFLFLFLFRCVHLILLLALLLSVFAEVLSSSHIRRMHAMHSFWHIKSHMDSICLFLSSFRASIYVISITLFFLSATALSWCALHLGCTTFFYCYIWNLVHFTLQCRAVKRFTHPVASSFFRHPRVFPPSWLSIVPSLM